MSSYVLTAERVEEAFDEALRRWQVRFAFPVLGQSCAGQSHGTAYRDEDSGASGYWSRGMDNYFWPLLLRSMAIGGDGPKVSVTMPSNIFTWTGPYQGNLRSILVEVLPEYALQQFKERAKGVWTDGHNFNRMRIRVPHK